MKSKMEQRIGEYYILTVTDPQLPALIKHCTGTMSDLRYSLDGTKVVLKRNNIDDGSNLFDELNAYNSEDILLIMNSAEWFDQDLFNSL